LPVSCVEFTDLEFAVAELTRMRERGMVAMYHIGDGPAGFVPGWWNIGGDSKVLRQIGSSLPGL
jgi:hypothetical protein